MNLACVSGTPVVYSFMFGVTTSDDYRPVAWMGRYPVDVTTILVALHVVCAILTAMLFATGNSAILNYAMFDSARIWAGAQVWREVTYAFIHSPNGSALFWFAIEMYLLFVFGREVERFVGRRAYIWLYLLLLIVPTLILLVWGLSERTALAGSGPLHFAIFVAFATIFPNVQFFMRIPAKWVAVILAAIGTLSALAARDWQTLAVLWTSLAIAFLFVELRGAGPELAWISQFKSLFRPKPRLHVVQKSSTRRVVEPDDVSSIDPILEKISKFGIGSLSDSERRQLDRARKRLLKDSQ
jgi:membrane associated rhomboid family serine protease